MGFFGKIKENLNHGGIKIDLQAPASVSMQDATLPVTVTITSTGEQHSITCVTAEIIATNRAQSFQQPIETDTFARSQQTSTQTVARADNAEAFVIMPGETKTVQINIIMNAGAAAQTQLPADSGMAQVAGAMQKLQTLSNALNHEGFSYSLRVSADVEGIALDPAKEQPLQIVRPGALGSAFNISV